MNAAQCIGRSKVLSGVLLELSGRFLGSRRQIQAGVSLQMRGKSQIAIGEAQQLIRLCMLRAIRSEGEQKLLSTKNSVVQFSANTEAS